MIPDRASFLPVTTSSGYVAVHLSYKFAYFITELRVSLLLCTSGLVKGSFVLGAAVVAAADTPPVAMVVLGYSFNTSSKISVHLASEKRLPAASEPPVYIKAKIDISIGSSQWEGGRLIR